MKKLFIAFLIAAAGMIASDAYAARRVGKLLMPEDAVNRIAVFTIPVNTEDGDAYTGFELREASGRFCARSELADEAFGAGDTMRMYVCTAQTGGNGQTYTRIYSTLAWTNRLTTVVVVLDVSNLAKRTGDWMRSDNASLQWSYLRNKPVDPPYEYEDGSEAGQWRPVVPVWFKKMPDWAK